MMRVKQKQKKNNYDFCNLDLIKIKNLIMTNNGNKNDLFKGMDFVCIYI
jgi:hypothetical protein